MVFAGKTDTNPRAERRGSKLENGCKDLKPTRAIMYINTESEPVVQDKGLGDIMYSMVEMAPHSSTLAWKIPWMRSMVGYSPWGHKESDMTERLHFHFQSFNNKC